MKLLQVQLIKVKPATPSNTTFAFKQNGEFEVIPNNANTSTTKILQIKLKLAMLKKWVIVQNNLEN